MGKKKIINLLQSIDKQTFLNDLKEHSLEYIKNKYSLTKKDYYASLKMFDIKNVLQVNRFWITNGIVDKFIYEDCIIPEGFYAGRVNGVVSLKDYKWINNGNCRTLIKKDSELPEGYVYGSNIHSTKGKKLYHCENKNVYLAEESVSEEYELGNGNTINYKISALKRKTYWYTNGVQEIKLHITDKIPEGYILGRLSKLTPQELIQKRDEYYSSLGYIAVKNLNRGQLSAYNYLRDNTDYIEDVIRKDNVYTYINKKYLNLLNEYAKTNHSKGVSELENSLFKFISSIYSGKIIRHCKSVLKDTNNKYYEIDIYLPDKHIGVEFNGIYWHSSLKLDKNYHFNKSKLSENLGIRLIHIYEHEWKDSCKCEIIKSMLRIALGIVDNKIYARKCTIKEITNYEAKTFNDLNHLQGHRNAQITYGLFYHDVLVQLMSFSKTKYNRNLKGNNSWEIIRGCPGSNNIVIGGVSKLLQYFIKQQNPKEIFSYCDFNKFDGRGYEAIGMKFIGYTGPNKWWVLKNRVVVERNPKRYREYKENSLTQIYGSGSKKYLYIV